MRRVDTRVDERLGRLAAASPSAPNQRCTAASVRNGGRGQSPTVALWLDHGHSSADVAEARADRVADDVSDGLHLHARCRA